MALQIAAIWLLGACSPEETELSGAASFSEFVALDLPAPDAPGPYEVTVDPAVGRGFEGVATSQADPRDSAACAQLAALFTQGAGNPGLDGTLYTLYRPSQRVPGKRYPVVSWANAHCAVPEDYRVLLSHLASHGFIVIATNSPWVSSAEPQRRAIDWVLQQNGDPNSPLYGMVDVAHIAAMGHMAAGAAATASVGRDARVDTTVLLNGGTTRDLKGPTLIVTGDRDVAEALVAFTAFSGAAVAAGFVSLRDAGYDAVIAEPARVYGPVTAWLRYQLMGDAQGRAWFSSADCALCKQTSTLEFHAKGLL